MAGDDTMRIDIITIFPEFFDSALSCSIIARAQAAGVVQIARHNLRDYTSDAHRTVDDYPYGGGAGMVMKPEPFARACAELLGDERPPVVLLAAHGEPFTQQMAARFAAHDRLVLLCGHYEGVDERVRQSLVTEEVSIGDYVLTGGEVAAWVVVDAVVRLLPGAVGNEQSPLDESYSGGLLEYPQYTRPAEFGGMAVPEVLLRGHHDEIRRWRRKESLRRTLQRRPELLAQASLTKEDRELLREIRREAP
jgi:tRNA (guanine37-N1)-methyltransferase